MKNKTTKFKASKSVDFGVAKLLSREIERNHQIRVLAKAKAFPVIFRRGAILESLSREEHGWKTEDGDRDKDRDVI